MAKKQIVTACVIAAAVAVIAGIKIFSHSGPRDMPSVEARSKGNPQARVQVIEFIDFECPACAAGAQVVKEYMDKHPDDIRLQVKYFPLLRPHPHAMQVALYSECAGRQGKFWEFHERLMPRQREWSPLVSAEPVFQEIAKQVGLDTARLAACVASEDAVKVINDDKTLGQSLGVQSTPTYFINNKMVVGSKALQEELDTYFPPK